jgi:hypothetical protein
MMKEIQKGTVNPLPPRPMSYQASYKPTFMQKSDWLHMELTNHVPIL